MEVRDSGTVGADWCKFFEGGVGGQWSSALVHSVEGKGLTANAAAQEKVAAEHDDDRDGKGLP